MNAKANKWKRSIQLLEKKSKNSKSKWQKYSADKRTVIHDFRTMTFPELLKKYPNFSDFFWRDKGESLLIYYILPSGAVWGKTGKSQVLL